ncbi:tail fiber protein [Photorhabdus viridis]|uniref:tail fiber protein n=1 Tax=Photorhabdus viridis TaxID=3163327 RepID=UPI00387E77D3
MVETVQKANNAVPSGRRINGKSLVGDISLSAGDVGAYPMLRSIDEIPTLGYNGPFRGSTSTHYARGVSIGDNDYGQIWVNSYGRLFAQFSNTDGERPGGECVYMDDITPIEKKANNAVPSSRKVNGKTLTEDISLSAGDVGALPGMTAFTGTSPGNEYQGVFSAQKDSYAKGINFGYVNYDTGQIYVNASGDLYAYFLHVNKNRYGGLVNTHPVGSPIPWPQPNPPSGYLACNGQAFNKSLYPQLAAAYPSGALPDLRGEFIRGWDDGRGVDSGRGVLSWQPQQVQWHRHVSGSGGYGGDFGATSSRGHNGSYHNDSQQKLPFTNNGSDFDVFTNNGVVGAETRPRNIAFNYIVRAA